MTNEVFDYLESDELDSFDYSESEEVPVDTLEAFGQQSAESASLVALRDYDDSGVDEVAADNDYSDIAAAEFAEQEAEVSSEDPVFPRDLQDSRKMMLRMTAVSGHLSGYTSFPEGYRASQQSRLGKELEVKLMTGGALPQNDFVNERRDSERAKISDRCKEQNEYLLRKGIISDEEPARITPKRHVSSEIKAVAELLGENPEDVKYPRHVAKLRSSQKNKLLVACANTSHPLQSWNKVVRKLTPRARGSMRHNGTVTIYRLPGAPEQVGLTGICTTAKNQEAAQVSKRWKDAAESHKAPSIKKLNEKGEVVTVSPVTKCRMTGDSLIIKKKKYCDYHKNRRSESNGCSDCLSSWEVGPNIHGLGLRGAHLVVEAAALLALPQDVLAEAYGKDYVGGTVDGEVPELVRQLSSDGQAWAILAAHTNHPIWGKLAKVLLALQNTCYFKLDEQEIRDSERIGSQIADRLRAAYPEQMRDSE